MFLSQTHICVGMSHPQRIVKVYKDGEFVKELTSGPSIVQGGGGLIFGQEQDSLYGTFAAAESFR